ncbi:MAG: hypothetical protein NTY50_04415 [Methylobacter sp.]|nr:hypothetical protein [Methylobacter sp.]
MPLKNRIKKVERQCQVSTEPDAFALSWWELMYQMYRYDNPDLPELPGRPSADWIEYYNGKTFDDLLQEYDEEQQHEH